MDEIANRFGDSAGAYGRLVHNFKFIIEGRKAEPKSKMTFEIEGRSCMRCRSGCGGAVIR